MSSEEFKMHGARRAAETFKHILQQVSAVEQSIASNTGLTFDLAKTLIESACKFILSERRVDYDRNDDLPSLFNKVIQALALLPPSLSQQTELRRTVQKTLGGLNSVVQGICELRNQCGFASHGSSQARPELSPAHAILAAKAADAVVGFLHEMHIATQPGHHSKSIVYDDNDEFNEYLDSICECDNEGVAIIVKVAGTALRPSRILFDMDPEAYKEKLEEFKNNAVDG